MRSNTCEVCSSTADKYKTDGGVFYQCPVCGRYELLSDSMTDEGKFDLNQLGSYLAYNGFRQGINEHRYYTNRNKEQCDEWIQNCKQGDNTNGQPVFLSPENVANWYPKTFSEKVDKILLYLNDKIKHVGEEVSLTREETLSALFVDRYDYNEKRYNKRDIQAQLKQGKYMLDYLIEKNYIRKNKATGWFDGSTDVTLSIQPEGYARIDELQRNTSDGKNVLVAMQFGEVTKELRKAIRKGISDAGYIAVFIDEVQHNDFITPELLKYIKNSKFVVADLTHKNNGAYFEEGYAMGLGKPVIQLCKKNVDLHFDIAQKNTIIWDDESDIPLRLKNRIIATIN